MKQLSLHTVLYIFLIKIDFACPVVGNLQIK